MTPKNLAVDIGNVALPAVAAFARGMKETISAFRGFVGGMSEGNTKLVVFGGTLITVVAIVPKIITAIRGIIASIRAWTAAQITLQAFAGPAGWATLAAGAVIAGAAVYGVDKAFSSYTESIAEASGETQKFATETRNIAQELALAEADRTAGASAYIDDLKEQNLELAMGADWVKEYKMMQGGINDAQKAEIARLKERNKQLKDGKELTEKTAAAAKKKAEDLKQQNEKDVESVNKFAEAVKSPFEEMVGKLTAVQSALDRGLVNSELAARARQGITKDFSGQQKTIKVELPPVAKRGSREEYAAITQIFSANRNREEQRHKEAMALRLAQKIAAERSATALENFRTTGAV